MARRDLGSDDPLPGGTEEDALHFAGATYQPEVYPGSFILFRCTENRLRLATMNSLAGADLPRRGSRFITSLPTISAFSSSRQSSVLAEKLREFIGCAASVPEGQDVRQRMDILPSSVPVSCPPLSLERWLEVERLPDQQRSLAEMNYPTWQNYVPRPYPGRVTLFGTQDPFDTLLAEARLGVGGKSLREAWKSTSSTANTGKSWSSLWSDLLPNNSEVVWKKPLALRVCGESGQSGAIAHGRDRAARPRKWRGNWRS